MHKILVVCFLLLVKVLSSQAPQKISYQGVARSATGAVLSNTAIAVKFDIHRGSALGTIIFTEQHQGSTALTTNAFGLFTTAIGSINSLSGIDWTNGPFFIEVSIDPANETSYSSVGTQELMSVPYALYAEKAGNVTPTPTISINSPNTVTNPSAGSYSINIPSSTVYSAGSGIAINAGVISSTVSIPTPTISGTGQAMVTSPSANAYVVNVPTQSLSISGNSLSISSGNTLLLPENTIMAGNSNITLNQSGNAYTITAVTPTLNVNGGTLTGTYPTQTLSIPSSSTTLAAGNSNITLNQSGNAYTITPVTPTLNVNGGTLTGTYPTQTLSIPSSSTTLAAGNSNITLNQSGNAYTITPVTPTLNVNGGTLTGTYPTQTLSIPSSSTTLAAGNSNITLNQSGNAYTITAVTPTLNVNGGTLTGTYPTQTLSIPSSSTTLAAGNSNITLNQSGNAYTITAVTPTLNVNGGTLTGTYPTQTLSIPSSSTTLAAGNSNITLNQSGNAYTITPVTPTLNVNGGTLTGTYPTQTLSIPSSSTTLVQGTNVTLNQNGNTYTVSASTASLAAGNSNITLNQSGNAYTITPVTPTLDVTGGTLTGTYPTQTLTIPSSSTTLVQGNNISLSQSGNTYTISSVSPTLSAGTNVTITPAGPANAYTISAATPSYTGTAGNINVNANTINLAATGVTAGAYGSAVSNAVPVFTVDNFGRLSAAGQYTPTILGDVIGTVNTSTVSKLRGVAISTVSPATGQVLQYTGSAWAPTTIATPWSLTGNAGTTASNFIGTTDNTPFRIRTNNTVKAIFTESGQLLLGNAGGAGPNSKLVVADGHIESTQASAPAIAGAGSLLGLAGSSASLSSNSTDVCGTISIYTGLLGGGGKGSYAVITFDKAYVNPPVVILTPRSEEAAGLRAYVTGTSTAGFTLAFSTGTSGLSTYEFNYMILAN
jgi:hypothetical protein